MKQFSRKSWCRGAFLTLCVVPTLLVAVWIVSRAVFGGGTLRKLVNLQAVFEPTENGPRLTASFHWPEAQDSGHEIQWSLARNADLSPPATSISVNTGAARLPCHLAALLWPPLERLGPAAE